MIPSSRHASMLALSFRPLYEFIASETTLRGVGILLTSLPDSLFVISVQLMHLKTRLMVGLVAPL